MDPRTESPSQSVFATYARHYPTSVIGNLGLHPLWQRRASSRPISGAECGCFRRGGTEGDEELLQHLGIRICGAHRNLRGICCRQDGPNTCNLVEVALPTARSAPLQLDPEHIQDVCMRLLRATSLVVPSALAGTSPSAPRPKSVSVGCAVVNNC